MHVKAKVAEEEPSEQAVTFYGHALIPRGPWNECCCAITSHGSASLALLFTYTPLELRMSSLSHVLYPLAAMTVP
jgi:hypothetical protein